VAGLVTRAAIRLAPAQAQLAEAAIVAEAVAFMDDYVTELRVGDCR
jgi:hypothetical protein